MADYRKGEDWKGEDAISAKPKTPMERPKMTNSQASRIDLSDDELQVIARKTADTLISPDKKQLRFNEIIEVARTHYSSNPRAGVIELVRSCDRAKAELYVAKSPLWQVLRNQYGWMAVT